MARVLHGSQPSFARGARATSKAATEARARFAAHATWPIVVIVVLVFGVSGGMLWMLGYNYDGLSGSMLTKIHPSTYLIFLMFGWYAIASGNPIGYAVRGAWLHPGAFVLVVAALVMFATVILRSLPGMAGTIDTFLPPALVVMLIEAMDERGYRHSEWVLHGLMTINALLGLFEFVTQIHVFPYRFDGEVFPFDTRSTALQGHPLVNAAVTACYTLALLTGGKRLPHVVRYSLIPLQLAALVTFGGRAATVVTFSLAAIYLLGAGGRAFRMKQIPLLGAAVGLIFVSLIPVLIAILAERGFFDLLLRRFVSDGGSANARVEMFDMFAPLSFRDLLVGPDIGLIESLRWANGLEWGIEQPIIKTLLYNGVFVMVMMLVALTAFLREVARSCSSGVWLPMLSFVILLQTSESISTKTTLLTKFVLMALCLYSGPRLPVAMPQIMPIRARR